MTVDTSLKTMLAASFLTIIIPAGFFFSKIPGAELSSSEIELTNIHCPSLIITPPSARPSYAGLDWPSRMSAGKEPRSAGTGAGRPQKAPDPAARGVAAQLAYIDRQPALSMIYLDESVKSAIIDRQVIQEGSRVGNYLVVRIEESRVLVRHGGKDTWLRLDQ